MIGINGLPVNQIARDFNIKSGVEQAESNLSFSESMKEVAREYMGKIESLNGFCIEELDFWKTKMGIEHEDFKTQDDVHDLIASFKQKIRKLFRNKENEKF